MTMNILDRLRDDVMWIDATDDAIEEIERLRQELAECQKLSQDNPKRPPDGMVPYAVRTEHKRPPPTPSELLAEAQNVIYDVQLAGKTWQEASRVRRSLVKDIQKIVRHAYEAGKETR